MPDHMTLKAICAIMMLTYAGPSVAEVATSIYAQQTPGLVKGVDIHVDDQVTDNCWTNAATVRSRIRLLFEQSDVPVASEELAASTIFYPRVIIGAYGLRNADMCAVTASFEVVHGLWSPLPWMEQPPFAVAVSVRMFRNGGIYTSGSNVNAELIDFFEGAAAAFLGDVLSARREPVVQDLFQRFPRMGLYPMTQAEFIEMTNQN